MARAGDLMVLAFRLLARLPLPLLHAFGSALGWGAYLLSPTYRRHLNENLALAYPHAPSRRLRRDAIAHAGRGFAELAPIWLRRKEDVVPWVTEVSGWEVVEAAWRAGKGIVFLTPHLGCFEIAAQYYAARAPITVLYRPPKQAWLRPLLESGREGPNLRLAPADLSGVRRLMGALKRREAVGLLPDQVPRKGEGMWSDFFGRPAYTMTLAARLLEVEGVQPVLAYAERLPEGRGFHLRLSSPSEPLAGPLAARVAALNRELEALVRRCPQQYLWGYNRYKVPRGAPPPARSAA